LARREEAARREGYQEGHAAATQAAEAKLQQALQRAAAAIQDTIETRQRMRRQMEEDLVHLAVAIARRILHRELQVDPEALTGVVKAAIQKLDARELHRVRACPVDAPLIERFISQLPLPRRVEIVSDPSLERGALILETTRGYLDASIEAQLREIDRGLTDMVKRA
jgi:flagellar assembly protein FliH